jgi:hypothetical protein
MRRFPLLPYVVAGFAGAMLVSVVAPDFVLHVVFGLFAICIALSWSVVAENGALAKGPWALLGRFDPTVQTRRTRRRTAFFFSAAAVAGACVNLLLRVAGAL